MRKYSGQAYLFRVREHQKLPHFHAISRTLLRPLHHSLMEFCSLLAGFQAGSGVRSIPDSTIAPALGMFLLLDLFPIGRVGVAAERIHEGLPNLVHSVPERVAPVRPNLDGTAARTVTPRYGLEVLEDVMSKAHFTGVRSLSMMACATSAI